MHRMAYVVVLLSTVSCQSSETRPLDVSVDATMAVGDGMPRLSDASLIDVAMEPPIIDATGPARDQIAPPERPCDPQSASDQDSDYDGLSDREEQMAGTSVCHADSDNDGVIDLAEIRYNSDPWDPEDTLENYHTIPIEPGWIALDVGVDLRLRQADFYLVLDNSGSMQGFIHSIAGRFAEMVERVSHAVPDATYGVATFSNYNTGQGDHDLPFRLLQQATSDVAKVQRALNGIVAGGGGLHEASYEALYQTMTGLGYDQNCNRIFDEGVDVRPFSPHAMDAFLGSVDGSEDEGTLDGGKVGGVGFRSSAYKIILYGTDEEMLDPERGDATPGGCPQDAGHTLVVEATRRLDAKLIGVAVDRGGRSAPTEQMLRLANDTQSTMLDDSGQPIPLVIQANDGALVDALLERVTRLLGAVRFERVNARIAFDALGIARNFAPESLGPIEPIDFGRPHEFRLELDAIGQMGETWKVTTVGVTITSDEGVEIGYQRFIVAIPPQHHR